MYNNIQSVNTPRNSDFADAYKEIISKTSFNSQGSVSNELHSDSKGFNSDFNLYMNTGIRNVPTGRTRVSEDPVFTPDANESTQDNFIENSIGPELTFPSQSVSIENKNPEIKRRIQQSVDKCAKKYNIDPNLILAVIKTESYFNPNCVSSAGAKGLMQLMPANFKHLGVTDPFNIEQNIDGGTKLLREYIDRYGGDIQMGLMAYNGGPSRMDRRGVKSIADIYKMPKETQNYVKKVMKYYRGE